MESNKSNSFSCYYYSVTDLLNAERIALAYSDIHIPIDQMTTYDIRDTNVFKYLVIINKNEDGFKADLRSENYMDPDGDEYHKGYKFNYILVLGLGDKIKAMVIISDLIDVSDWQTDFISIEFRYNVIEKSISGDMGTLVSVHISDDIRNKVHKILFNQIPDKKSIDDFKSRYNPFIRSLTNIKMNEFTHYSGKLCQYLNNGWSSVKNDKINVPNNSYPVRILKDKRLVYRFEDNLYITDVLDDNDDPLPLGLDSIITNNYVIDNNSLYLINGNKLTLIKDQISCRYFINNCSNDLIFYRDRKNYSKNFKVFELIDDLKSNNMIDSELGESTSSNYNIFTDMLYIKVRPTGNKLLSYLHSSDDSGTDMDDFDNIVFITDVLFITKLGDEFYLYEDTVTGLKKYYLGIDNYLYNIYMVSKYRTNPHIPTSHLLSCNGLLYYFNGTQLISV